MQRNFRGRRATRNNLSRRINNVRNIERPRQVRGPADPPNYVQMPWWQVIVSDTITLNTTSNSKVYTGEDITGIFKAQCIISSIVISNADLSFRIQRIDAWEMSGKNIGLQVADFGYGLGSADFIFQGVDAAGRNRWAHLSFIPPRSQTNLVVAGNDKEKLFEVNSSESGPKFVVRVHLMWKFRVENSPNVAKIKRLLTGLQLEDAIA